MICERCGERDGEVRYTEYTEDGVEKLFVCRECAEDLGFDSEMKEDVVEERPREPALGKLLGPVDVAAALAGDVDLDEEPDIRRCSTCGASAVDLEDRSLFGCADCYQVFAESLDDLFLRAHDATAHRGRTPAAAGPRAEVPTATTDASTDAAPATAAGEVYRRLAEDSPPWLRREGPEGSIILSSRVRLARNLPDAPFPHRADSLQSERVCRQVRAALDRRPLGEGVLSFDFEQMSHRERRLLVERHLASPRLAVGSGPRGVWVAPEEDRGVMVNEEDQLRIQAVVAGLDLETALRAAREIDLELEAVLPFAFDEQRGYLTACPTNTGTGLRASVLIHLPALVAAGEIRQVHRAVAEMGMAVRGWFGEGSQAAGDYYQLSNQRTLGLTEEEGVEKLEQVARRALELELDARSRLREHKVRGRRLEDRIHRSWATLRAARLLPVAQLMACLSDVRMGIHSGFLDEIPGERLNRLAMLVQPAHLETREDRPLDPEEADWIRAETVRKAVAEF